MPKTKVDCEVCEDDVAVRRWSWADGEKEINGYGRSSRSRSLVSVIQKLDIELVSVSLAPKGWNEDEERKLSIL